MARRFLSFFLSTLLFVILTISILGIASYHLLFPGIYERALKKTDFNIIEKNNQQLKYLKDMNVKSALSELITNTLFYIRGKSDSLDLTFEVNKEELRNYFASEIEKKSYCNIEEDPFKADNNINCRPRNKTTSEFLDEILERRNETILEEGKVDLGKTFNLTEETLAKPREFAKYYQISLLILILISLALIFLVYKINESKRTALSILGIDFLFVSLVVFLIGHYLKSFIVFFIQNSIPLFKEFFLSIVSELFGKLLIYEISIAIIGIILITASLFIPKKKQ